MGILLKSFQDYFCGEKLQLFFISQDPLLATPKGCKDQSDLEQWRTAISSEHSSLFSLNELKILMTQRYFQFIKQLSFPEASSINCNAYTDSNP